MQRILLPESEDGGVRRIAEQLLAGRYRETTLPDDLVVSDIQNSLDRFRLEFLLLEELEYFPVLAPGSSEAVPLSISILLGERPSLYGLYGASLLRWRRRELLARVDEAMSDVPIELGAPVLMKMPRAQVHASLTEKLTAFLSFRLDSVRSIVERGFFLDTEWRGMFVKQNRGGRPIETPGCVFKAETRSDGLTVLWSPAFFIAPNYFGAPSSPVTRLMQAGMYKFGVSHRPGRSVWDLDSLICIPDANSIYLQF